MNAQEIISSLRMLHNLSKALNSTLNVDEVMAMIFRHSKTLMHSKKVVVFLLSSPRTLTLHQYDGFEPLDFPRKEFHNIASFDHCIVHKGTVISLTEVLSPQDVIFLQKHNSPLLRMFFAPLEIQGAAYGLLGVEKAAHDFSEIELEIFCSLGSQAAVAMENASLYEQLRQTFLQTAEAMAEAISSRDPYTGGHTERVGNYCQQLGKSLGLSGDTLLNLRLAAVLHDIGKIGVTDNILRKSGKLTEKEKKQMDEHPDIATHILGHIAGMKKVLPGVRHHHEWFDGSGYPDGLCGNSIPLAARIIAIADAYDALTTDRPYRTSLSPGEALRIMRKDKGAHFDPDLFTVFADMTQRASGKAAAQGHLAAGVINSGV